MTHLTASCQSPDGVHFIVSKSFQAKSIAVHSDRKIISINVALVSKFALIITLNQAQSHGKTWRRFSLLFHYGTHTWKSESLDLWCLPAAFVALSDYYTAMHVSAINCIRNANKIVVAAAVAFAFFSSISQSVNKRHTPSRCPAQQCGWCKELDVPALWQKQQWTQTICCFCKFTH